MVECWAITGSYYSKRASSREHIYEGHGVACQKTFNHIKHRKLIVGQMLMEAARIRVSSCVTLSDQQHVVWKHGLLYTDIKQSEFQLETIKN